MNKAQIVKEIESRIEAIEFNKKHLPVGSVTIDKVSGWQHGYRQALALVEQLEEFPISELYAELGILQDELYDNQEHGEANGVKMAMIRIGQFVKRKKAESEQSTAIKDVE